MWTKLLLISRSAIKSAADTRVTKAQAKSGKAKGKRDSDDDEDEDDAIDDRERTPIPAKPRAKRISVHEAAEQQRREGDSDESVKSVELPSRRKSVSKQDNNHGSEVQDDVEMVNAAYISENDVEIDQDDDDDHAVEELLRSNGKKRELSEVADDDVEDEHDRVAFPPPPSSANSISDMKRKKKKAKGV